MRSLRGQIGVSPHQPTALLAGGDRDGGCDQGSAGSDDEGMVGVIEALKG